MRRFGIDVSQAQGSVNWNRAKTKIGFAFVKATEGIDWEDPTFTTERVKALRKAAIPFGCYHFARPQPGRDGAEEADHLVRVARERGWGKTGDLPCALDLEAAEGVSAEEVRRFKRRFVSRYQLRTGHLPIIYTGSFWRDFMGNPVIHARCRLWLAAYTPTWRGWVPRAWKKPFIWQFTDSAGCPGVHGDVDGDRFLRSRRAFERMRLKPRRKR